MSNIKNSGENTKQVLAANILFLPFSFGGTCEGLLHVHFFVTQVNLSWEFVQTISSPRC